MDQPSHSTRSSSRSSHRPPPAWIPGLFYPLIVACLVAVVATLSSLREDVAVLKVRVETLEKSSGAYARKRTDTVPARTYVE